MSDSGGYGSSDFSCDDELFRELEAREAHGYGAERVGKRLRLSPAKRDAQQKEDIEDSGISSDSSSQFQSPERFKRERGRDKDEEKLAARKSRTYTPKYHAEQQPTFVSQTQPPSSPYRIRAPRWKAPTLAEKSPHSRINLANQISPIGERSSTNNRPREESDDIKAAIAASLQSYKEEHRAPGVAKPLGVGSDIEKPSSPVGPTGDNIEDVTFDVNDFPSDAFDSDIDPGERSDDEPVFISSARRPSQAAIHSQSSSFRQTTLLGGFASSMSKPSSQSHHRSRPIANRIEQPTHHKLNKDDLDTWVFPANLGSKREYQFNIANKALFHNLLVALPTGLGKTFIAATAMLNWFRWTEDSQIVFVAPTKPLVSQQVEACFHIAGIPRSKTTLLTGNTPPGVRAEEWKSRRVFFMTPQTIMNDLKSGIADPKRIVLLVVDEAHRATGAYAYVEIVKFLQRFNNSFRVMALTATPGATVEAVQEVIDGLSISKIEIRTENSLDIRQFIHKRNIEVVTFDNSPEMETCMELFAKALQTPVDKLRTHNAYWGRDPIALTPFGLTKARQDWNSSPAGRNAPFPLKGMINSIFTVLASLAHAIDLLKYHGIGPFFRSLVAFEDSVVKEKKGGKCASQIATDGNFKTLIGKLRSWTTNQDFIGHPKLAHLKQAILNYFLDADSKDGKSDTRVMIFSHFRDSAEEIVRVLKKHQPMIRPHVFVGQANAKGSEGMDQKTQLDVVSKFKAGTYNTIVATSIGEEGLDIGEVDLIICYDGHSSPIRMLQRMGRTGRKRAGNIILLLSKGKEEQSYVKAKDNYEKMQQLIASGKRFEFHEDKSSRILPRDIQPEAEERVIEIPIENSQPGLPEPAKRARAPKRPPKKFHMPDGVETGFTSASRVGRTKTNSSSSSKKRKSPVRSPSPELAEVPTIDELFVTQSQDLAADLEFQAIAGKPIRRPRMDAFPDLQRRPRPTRYIPHGKYTRRVIKSLRRMGNPGFEGDEQYRELVGDPDKVEKDFDYLSTDREDDIGKVPSTNAIEVPSDSNMPIVRCEALERLLESDSDDTTPALSQKRKLYTVHDSDTE